MEHQAFKGNATEQELAAKCRSGKIQFALDNLDRAKAVSLVAEFSNETRYRAVGGQTSKGETQRCMSKVFRVPIGLFGQ